MSLSSSSNNSRNFIKSISLLRSKDLSLSYYGEQSEFFVKVDVTKFSSKEINELRVMGFYVTKDNTGFKANVTG